MVSPTRAAAVLAALIAAASIAALPSPVFSQTWICGDDAIVAQAQDATVVVDHVRSTYNCCPLRFDFDVTVGGGVIDVLEVEVLDEEICLCWCCYDHRIEVSDVAAGDWLVRLTYFEPDIDEWIVLETTVDVGDLGQPGLAAEWTSWDSGCLAPGTPVQPGVEPTTWSRTKAHWR